MSDDVKKALEEKELSEPKTVAMACRRSSHVDGRAGSSSEGLQEANTPGCPSNRAIPMNDVTGHSKQHMMYRCVDCGYTWSVGIGGGINI